MHKYGGVPIYADACRWAGVEHMIQYVRDWTEAFDDPLPAGKRMLESGRAFERMLNPLSAFMFMHNFVLEDGGLGSLRSGGGRRICLGG